ncbi:MAG: SDR family oxidoreductase [Salibacteraceae bacterium]
MRALITGATRGIGRAVAHALAKEGYDLAITARSLSDLEDLRQELRGIYPHLEIIARSADLMEHYDIDALAQTVVQHWGGVDVLVNNVGAYTLGRLGENEPRELETSLKVNLLSAYKLTLPLLPAFKAQGSGHIFNIGSIVTRQPRVEAANYTIAKFALDGFTKVLAEEMRDHGVKVCSILPGSVNTSSWDGIEAPKETFVQPEDVARSIVAAIHLSSGAWIEELVIRPTDRNF